jgi:hypothetical protein
MGHPAGLKWLELGLFSTLKPLFARSTAQRNLVEMFGTKIRKICYIDFLPADNTLVPWESIESENIHSENVHYEVERPLPLC